MVGSAVKRRSLEDDNPLLLSCYITPDGSGALRLSFPLCSER
jgi:hypothetical protein